MPDYDEATVRAWAYDPDRDYIDDRDQDEDLTIGRLSPELLLPLIDDPECPKSDYILQCLDYLHRAVIQYGQEPHLERTRAALEVAKRFHGKKVKDWSELLERRLSYHTGVGPISRNRALAMGWELLLDPLRTHQEDVSVIEENDTSYVVELKYPNPKYWERLTIDKSTGRFSFSRGPGY